MMKQKRTRNARTLPVARVLEPNAAGIDIAATEVYVAVPTGRDPQHSVGLLRASHRPAQTICAVRSIWRHRESLVQMAAAHIQHMQKALDQMNLQLHHVISDISGTTGLSIIDAILDGERNPETLAALRDPRI